MLDILLFLALVNKNKHIIIGIVHDFSDLGANSGRTFNLNIPISKEVLSQVHHIFYF